MLNENHEEILKILNNAPNKGLSTTEIFKAVCENHQTQIPDPEALSKMIYSIRAKGYITTSEAGKNKAHKITKTGIQELNISNAVNDVTPKKIEPEIIATKYHENDFDDDMPDGDDPFYLDPSNEIEKAMILVASSLREAITRPEPVTIARKEHKIATLNRLGALMSDDIRDIFNDISNDLSQLVEQ